MSVRGQRPLERWTREGQPVETGFELWFVPAQGAQPKFRFPCDEQGGVDMNSLGRLKLNDYLYARAGSKFASLFQRVVSRL
jgi:hypothetical protein